MSLVLTVAGDLFFLFLPNWKKKEFFFVASAALLILASPPAPSTSNIAISLLPCASEGCGRIGVTVFPDVYELSRSPAHVSQRCRRLRLLRDLKGKQTEAYFFFVNLAIVYSSVRSRLTKQPSATGECAPLRTPAVIRNEHICSHVTDTCWNKSLGSLSRI